MANYIIKLNDFTQKIAEKAATLEKTDCITILSDEQGVIPILLYPLLQGLKCKTNFVIVKDAVSPEAFAFNLGMLCSGLGSEVFLVMPEDDSLKSLDGQEFQMGKTSVTIHVSSSFTASTKPQRSKPVTRRRKNAVSTTMNPPVENSPLENLIQEQMPEEKTPVDTDPKATETFVKELTKIESKYKGRCTLVKNAETLAECIKNSSDKYVGFPFQLQLKFTDAAEREELVNALSPNYDKLKSLLH